MKGLDTNILVRYITRDDLVQSRKADEFLESLTPFAPGFVSLVSLIELVWVLRSQYSMPKSRQIECLKRLFSLSELVIENYDAAALALNRFVGGKADFADCLIESSCAAAGCTETVTFDVAASRFAGMRLL